MFGKGDAAQEQLLNTAADDEGFRAVSMVFDASGVPSNAQIVVMMEKET